MRRIFYLVILQLIIVTATIAAEPQGALLHCDSLVHNFGMVDRREGEVRHIFNLENRGDKPLVITNVVTSCSCVKVSVSRKPISVGESREMKVVYEARKMPPGAFNKSVLLHTTSRDNIPTKFTIMGRAYTSKRKDN